MRGGTYAACDRPSSRNICLMPRIAWRVRASFSISAKRTCPSPNSPNPMPGLWTADEYRCPGFR
jgi:hypothetical protein